jgi:small-conductance mechanosensitive channel
MMDYVLLTVAFAAYYLCLLAIYGGSNNPLETIGAAATTIWGLQYLFGGLISQTFETIAFIFIDHPFDVGDSIKIGSDEYLVLNVGWWQSTLKNDDGSIAYMPTSSLKGAVIGNTRRSAKMSKSFKIQVERQTTSDKLKSLHELIQKFLTTNKRKYSQFGGINIEKILDNSKIEIAYSVTYPTNFQDCADIDDRDQNLRLYVLENLTKSGISLA